MPYLGDLFGLRNQYFLPFDSFSLNFVLHGLSNFFWWVDAQNFIAQTLNSPLVAGLIHSRMDLFVDFITFLEQLVEFELTDLASHHSQSEKPNAIVWSFHLIGCLDGVHYTNEQYSIDLQRDIIFGDDCLFINIDC